MIAVLLALAGCGKGDDAPAPAPGADASVATQPTTAPVSVPASTLTIDGKAVAFPPIQMRLSDVGDTLSLLFYTPESALLNDATANTVLLNMTIEADSIADLTASSAHLAEQAIGSETDTPNGLFLDGGATQLFPTDVNVTFSGDPAHLIVAEFNGTFAMLTSASKQRTVKVTGKLAAGVEELTPTTVPTDEEVD